MPRSQEEIQSGLDEVIAWWNHKVHPFTKAALDDFNQLIFSNDISVEQVIEEESDLPDPSGGVIQLEDSTAYAFDGFVSSQYPLQLGDTSVLLAPHGGLGGFIHTGGDRAVIGRDEHFFARDLLISAPGGQALDIEGTLSKEVLAESISIADPAGMGNLSSLGTIDGMRVPSFKGCNFEDFNEGLTLTGSPDKVFFESSPIRNVDNNGVSCLIFDGSFTAETVSIVNCYVKGIQADTKVVDYQGTIPSDIFQYRGVTHDPSVTKSNILTGNVGREVVGVRVADSYPLADSTTTGIVTLDAETTTTISTQDTYVPVEGATTLSSAERVTKPAGDPLIGVEGRRTVKLEAQVDAVLTGQNGDIYEIAITYNGSIVTESEAQLEAGGQNAPLTIGTFNIQEYSSGDEVGLQIRNKDSTADVTFRTLNLALTPV